MLTESQEKLNESVVVMNKTLQVRNAQSGFTPFAAPAYIIC